MTGESRREGITSARTAARWVVDHLHWYRTYLGINLGVAHRQSLDPAAILADVSGPLSSIEVRWLVDRVRMLPEGASALEIGVGSGQSTCALALGCWGTNKRVHTLCSPAARDPATEVAETYMRWHGTVIRKYLVPYVVPVVARDLPAQISGEDVALLCLSSESARDVPIEMIAALLARLRPGCVVVLFDATQMGSDVCAPARERLDRIETAGRLEWGRVRS